MTGMHIIAVNRGHPEHIPGHAALTGIQRGTAEDVHGWLDRLD